MSDKPLDTDGQSLNIDQLIADFKARADAGEQFSFEKLLAVYPEHTEDLTRYFKQGNESEAPLQPDKAGAEESSTGTSAPGKISLEDATAHTMIQGTGDSESSLTRDFRQPNTEATAEIEISKTFSRYEIQKVLGQGAMGAVYLARDTQLDRNVALKIPKFGDGNGVDEEELLARFYREARAAATLRSPNICPVYDVGEIDGQHYITMAFIEGRPLKDYTKSKKTHSEKQIITTIRKLALGLAEAHEIGVIHRDLKPANIMVDLKGEPVVMDFGLARRSSSDDVQVTQSGAIIGTPAYMAPEQVAGDQAVIDHQVDIYALGVIMYELITGEMPFKGNLMALLQQIALNNPTKPSELRSDIDPRLEAICLKMIAGDREQRYQSMTDVANDLQEVLRNPDERHKQAQAKKKGPKPKSLPTAKEESNPALISIDRTKSSVVRMRAKQGKRSSSTGKATAASKSKSSGPSKHLMIAGGGLGALLLLVIVSFVSGGKYDVQITLDDPSITLSVDGETLNINNGGELIKLSAGEHKLQLEKDGLKTHVEEFTVTKDGKTTLAAKIVNGQLDALLNGEVGPKIAARSPSETSQTKKAAWQDWPADVPPPAVAPFDANQAKAHQQAWADYLGLPVEYTNSIGMKFRLIPPGEFLMGSTPEEIEAAIEKLVLPGERRWEQCFKSEGPHHKVILTHPIYVGATEVTQSQYEQVMRTNPSHFSATGEGKDLVIGLDTSNYPVETVSWNDAAEFCAKLSQQEKLKPFYVRSGETVMPLDGTGYRLPTEAEWEFACRGGTTTRFWSGDGDQDLSQTAWSGKNSRGRSHEVGTLKANPFDLSDMHGNVWEWVQDSWQPEFYGKFEESAAVDPSSPFPASSERVIRGGNWFYPESRCRSSLRFADFRSLPSNNGIGFRVVLPVDAVKRPSNSTAWQGWPADAPPTAVAPFDAAKAKTHQQAWADYLGVPVEYENSIGMKFRLIPPGEFMMGSTPEEIETTLKEIEERRQSFIKSQAPQHKVVLTQPIYVGVTEVTQAQYKHIMGVNPSHFATTGKGKDTVAGLETGNHPVESVSWNDAAEFCAKLSQQEELKPFYFRSGETVTSLDGTGYRLPTEAEWEFLCPVARK